MRTIWGLLGSVLAFFAAVATQATPAHAQLVDNPQNLVKAWVEIYNSRRPEALSRVYARDAHLWGLNASEVAVGIDNIRKRYQTAWQNTPERTVTITKLQTLPRKRVTILSGTMELRSKDPAAGVTPARFTMVIVRESRRQWSIISHHLSALPK